ncbi:MAG TPA: tagaturonate epimerase family protein [Anaerolineae bacterium]|nr:tagaturonate epimerase family protein [Anaerolineae bacterium]
MNLTAFSRLKLFPRSLVSRELAQFGLAQTDDGPRLAILTATADAALLQSFEGKRSQHDGHTLILGSLSPRNAAALRDQLPWLKPRPLGLRTSIGFGDRLGLATPGHVRAVRAAGNIAPIFAQQSIREMTRTGRTPQQVMDDALWGVFQEGWRHGLGADADHLKTTTDIDRCAVAGFTFFTIDPGEYVNNMAETATLFDLRDMAEQLPPDQQPAATGLLYQDFDLEGHLIHFDEHTLLKAIVKYGRAVLHVARLYQHLISLVDPSRCELEVSVDETEQPTSHAEHVYIASELKRLGVKWVSLAPRYIGRFEKGVDYLGDVLAFEKDLAVHAAIARHFGPYKLSLHSGSDKFSIYPAVMRQTRGLVHLKTAGTSYLEALRTIAPLDTSFFRKIYAFARECYDVDKASYHVSTQLSYAPTAEDLTDAQLLRLLDQFDAREVLHVTFGSVLTECNADGSRRFYDRLMSLLRANPEAYAANLEKHFARHLQPFTAR